MNIYYRNTWQNTHPSCLWTCEARRMRTHQGPHLRDTSRHQCKGLPSSLKVKRPIWGKSLKVSRQMVPAVLKRAMHTWSCFTKRGRVLLFSPDFLSTKQIKAYPREKDEIRTLNKRIFKTRVQTRVHPLLPIRNDQDRLQIHTQTKTPISLIIN